MRASQHRTAMLGAAVFLLLSGTIGCLQQAARDPFRPGAHGSISGTEQIPTGVHLGEYSLEGIPHRDLPSHLARLAPHFYEKPQNAHKQEQSLQLIPERPGRELDIEQTKQRILHAKPGERVEPVWKTVQPTVTIADLRPAAPVDFRQLGQFSTPILDTKPDRVENIRVTTQLVNNTVVEPGQEFSFNKIVGMPTKAKGFRPGTVFGDGGQLKQELGGGMCQVSSTLYNVALETGMEILERHPHSKPVPYIAPGRDATIYDDKDLRFRNPLAKPVIIKSWVANGRTYVAFYLPVR
ncbi:VanW family protein [Effusibacillus pohliae]|uniref:VanW family protein n=1 Tax=Effusibacillus pohliae TaxID=232270 RepID=UPI000382A842|nr:VanW family protein [Effusibacillus pohliae]